MVDSMTAIEFKAVREYLGLDQEWVARSLGLTSNRQVRKWEAGDAPIPDGVRRQIKDWERQTGDVVGRTVEQLLDAPEPALALPREGEPGGWPARWHRHVAMRVALEVPGLVICEQGAPRDA